MMEFCGGGSCADLLESLGPLPEPFIAAMCRETLAGLEYLHKNHKLHRDVKGAAIVGFCVCVYCVCECCVCKCMC